MPRRVEGWACGAVLATVVLGGLVAERLVTPDASVGRPWAVPSRAHPLGLDHLGRDVASRVLVGGVDLVLVCLLAGGLAGVIGTAIALVGWRWSRVAALVRQVSAVALVLPGIVILLLCAIFLGPDAAVVVVMLLLGIPLSARTISAAMASSRRSGFVEAALLRGDPPRGVLVREVLPGISGAVVADIGMRVIAALQLSLALQLIAPTERVTWAAMVPAGLSGVTLNPWAVVAPSVAIAVVAGAIAIGLDVIGQRWLPPLPRRERGRRVGRSPSRELFVDHLEVHTATGRRLVAVPQLRAGAGEVIGIHGPSGSGKTTFLRALCGIVPDGCRLSGTLRSPDDVALVSQDQAATLDPLRRVGDIVRDGRREVRPDQVDEALARVGLGTGVARRRPHGLSGGEAARVGLARALVGRPRMLLLDEPTSGLDPRARGVVIAALRALRDEGALLVVVSHDPVLLEQLSARPFGLGDPVDEDRRRPAPPGSRAAVLVARDLRVTAPGGRPLLEEAHLHLSSGELVALLGPSGSGKSTLGRVLAGLHPATGQVTLHGDRLSLADWEWTPVRTPDQRMAVQRIGQDPRSELNPAHSLLAQVERSARIRHTDPAESRAAATRALDELGISEDVAGRRPAECSGGQRQRAVVARALVVEPEVVVADEPSSALDAHSRDLVMGALERVRARGGTVLVITHDPEVVADRTLLVREGGVRTGEQAGDDPEVSRAH